MDKDSAKQSSLVPLKSTAALATEELKIADRAKVSSGVLIGGKSVSIHASAVVADVISGGQVLAMSNSQVTSSLRSVLAPQLQAGASISGASRIADIGLRPIPFLLEMPSKNTDSFVSQSQILSLNAGDHGSLTAYQGATVLLSSGIHRFKNLAIESGGKIQLADDAAGTIIVVENNLTLRGTVQGNSKDLALIDFGTDQIPVDAGFRGTILAPKASIALGNSSSNAAFRGSLFAKNIEISSPVEMIAESFEHWELLVPPQPLATCTSYARGVKLTAFGYVNYLDEAVTIPKGPLNRFVGAGNIFNRGDYFLPGENPVDSLLTAKSTPISWHLGGSVATSTGQEPPCTSDQLKSLIVATSSIDTDPDFDPIRTPVSKLPPRALSQPPRPVPVWSGSLERSQRRVIAGPITSAAGLQLASSSAPTGVLNTQALGMVPEPGQEVIGRQIKLDLTRIRFKRREVFGSLHQFYYAGYGGCFATPASSSAVPQIYEGEISRETLPSLLEDCSDGSLPKYIESYPYAEMNFYNDGDALFDGGGRIAAISEGLKADATWANLPGKDVPWDQVQEPNANHYLVFDVKGKTVNYPVALMLAVSQGNHSSYLPISGSVNVDTGVFTPNGFLSSEALSATEWRIDEPNSDYDDRFHGPVNIRVQVTKGDPLPNYTDADKIQLCPELGGDYVDLNEDMPNVTKDENGMLVYWGRFPGAKVSYQIAPHPDSLGKSIPPELGANGFKDPDTILSVSATLDENGCLNVPAASLVGLKNAHSSISDVFIRMSLPLMATAVDADSNSSMSWELTTSKTVMFSVADVKLDSSGISNDTWGSPIPGGEIILRSAERGPEIRAAISIAGAMKYFANPTALDDNKFTVKIATSCVGWNPGTSCASKSSAPPGYLRIVYLSGARISDASSASIGCDAISGAAGCGSGESCYDPTGSVECTADVAGCKCMPLDATFWQGIVAHEVGHVLDAVVEYGTATQGYQFACVPGSTGTSSGILSCDCDPDLPGSPCLRTNSGTVVYNDLAQTADSLCNCDGTEKTDGAHCMSSVEHHERTIREAFAHFIASEVQYPTNKYQSCAMSYYKDVPEVMVNSEITTAQWYRRRLRSAVTEAILKTVSAGEIINAATESMQQILVQR